MQKATKKVIYTGEKKNTQEDEHTLAPPYTGEKKLIKMGSTIYVQVPPEFLKSNDINIEDIERGKTVMVMANRDMLVSARPEKILQAHDTIERAISNAETKKDR